jgi:hypothetical protein
MAKPDPAAQASFRLVPQQDGSYGVEVTIPETYPTMVTGFASMEAAETWVMRYKQRVESGPPSRRRWSAKGASS